MQHSEEAVHVCISVRENIEDPTHMPSECCIFRVHNHLRKVNANAYDPNIISIGPYHCNKRDSLQMMEAHKWRYLQLLLRRNESYEKKCIDALRSLEGKVRKCYAEPLKQNANELVNMMLLDGCFIVELMRKFTRVNSREKNDRIFQIDWIVNSLQRDLLLFENQIPFFVLVTLFEETKDPNDPAKETFCYLAKRFFKDILPGEGRADRDDSDSPHKCKHLLQLVHNNWRPLFRTKKPISGGTNKKQNPKGNSTENIRNFKFIHCATELKEAGIKFRRSKGNLFCVDFDDGSMKIPPLTIEDRTESFLRNLIAHEQYLQGSYYHFVSDYVKFLDCLINSPKDVEVLRHQRIINNCLGDDEVVSNMFNKMAESITWSAKFFHYNEVFDQVNAHYSDYKNRWMAILRRKYLNNPWAITSVFAGFVLLLLTSAQTVFSILSYIVSIKH